MDKEDVVYIDNEILPSHKKEHIWVSSNEVDEPRAYYTEWSQKEKNKYHTDTYIWNLKRWDWWNYLQGSSGDTDIENRLMDMGKWGGEEGEGGMYGESNMET